MEILYQDNAILVVVKPAGGGHYETDSFVSGCLDVNASIHKLLGLDTSSENHGVPLPLGADEDKNPREYITSSSNGQQFGLYTNRMIRGDRYKYIWNLTDVEVYHKRKAHGIDSLPGNLLEAVECLSGDPLIVNTLGDHVFTHYTEGKRLPCSLLFLKQ